MKYSANSVWENKDEYDVAVVGAGHASVSEWIRKVKKGAWRMPWLSEAMKDVISCDKLWGGANDL